MVRADPTTFFNTLSLYGFVEASLMANIALIRHLLSSLESFSVVGEGVFCRISHTSHEESKICLVLMYISVRKLRAVVFTAADAEPRRLGEVAAGGEGALLVVFYKNFRSRVATIIK